MARGVRASPPPIFVQGVRRIDDTHYLVVVGSNVGMYMEPEVFSLVVDGKGKISAMDTIVDGWGEADQVALDVLEATGS